MSEKKKVAVTEKKPSAITKVITFFRQLPKRIAQPFKNMWRELKKVTWPTPKETTRLTGVVLAVCTFLFLLLMALNFTADELFKTLSR